MDKAECIYILDDVAKMCVLDGFGAFLYGENGGVTQEILHDLAHVLVALHDLLDAGVARGR